MTNRNLFFHSAVILLLILIAETTSANSDRDLIGYNQIMDLIPMQGTTSLSSAAPSPVPQMAVTEGRIDPSEADLESPSPVIQGKPTKFPTLPPTPFPTRWTPSATPSSAPSVSPRPSVSMSPTAPTTSPTEAPSQPPTSNPSSSPTVSPTEASSSRPSASPTEAPSIPPTDGPSNLPSLYPSDEPSQEPSTSEPSGSEEPSMRDTNVDTSVEPSVMISTETIEVEGRTDDSEDETIGADKTISETICDEDKAGTWGNLCAALKASNLFQIMGDERGQYTLFAPTNGAFDAGDYTLEALLQDRGALRDLMSIHIVPLALSYDALTCNLNSETLNFDRTYTICMGDTKFQTSDGNLLRNLPVIDQSEDVVTKNGVIHSISNLILPFEFSVGNHIDTESPENDVDITVDINNQNVDNGSIISSDVMSDVVESDAVGEDKNDTDVSDTSSDVVGSEEVEEDNNDTDVSDTLSNNSMDGGDNLAFECQVCKDQELCAISRSAVMRIPGEGKVSCISVVERQNTGRLNMLPSICNSIQKQFTEYCLIGGN
ncbi:unnamed protein product [Pseudo-nitzschia multistriata]|uniref:FAS1 domain-containing protein n=1 Tax=Pseudo-nitzschia multistriata TaxID=183589 RepID=A0A448Z3L1_9STRA|nr:unnamed protein product [Pseudo-nitzschia multistriata]